MSKFVRNTLDSTYVRFRRSSLRTPLSRDVFVERMRSLKQRNVDVGPNRLSRRCCSWSICSHDAHACISDTACFRRWANEFLRPRRIRPTATLGQPIIAVWDAGSNLARARPAVPLGLWSITSFLCGNLYVPRLHKFIKWFADNDVAHHN